MIPIADFYLDEEELKNVIEAVKFDELVSLMVKEDINRLERKHDSDC